MSDPKTQMCCCTCGDSSYYAVIEERELHWFLTDENRGIGICLPCSQVLDESELVLPMAEESHKENDGGQQ